MDGTLEAVVIVVVAVVVAAVDEEADAAAPTMGRPIVMHCHPIVRAGDAPILLTRGVSILLLLPLKKLDMLLLLCLLQTPK